MATIKELTGNVYFWIDNAKVTRFPINLLAMTDCISLFNNMVDPVYTKVTIETPAFTKEFPIDPEAN
jgi:hypothetical protein